MKKNIYTLLTFMSIFILSACGGGSSASSVIPEAENEPSVILINAEAIVTDINGQNFALALHFLKNENGNYLIELNNLQLEVEGCTIDTSTLIFNPSTVVLDGNALSQKNVSVSGQFSSACIDAGTKQYSVSADMRISIDGQVETSKLILSSIDATSGGGTTTPPPSSGYSFINATDLTVTAANDTKNISVDLIDSATGVGVPGKDISITTISSVYGIVSPSTVQTGPSGQAVFTYTSPSTLISGSTIATLRFVDDAGNEITQDITITTIPPAGGSTEYSFINETNLTVTVANTVATISVDLINTATGVGVSTQDVSLSTISTTYGSITPSITQTDEAGRASFIYTSPTQLIDGSTTATLSFTDTISGASITKEITITTVSLGGGSSEYNLTNETTPVIVNYDNELKNISVDVVDQSGIGIPNVDVSITVVSGVEYGSIISASTVKSDLSGRALFSYQAPADVSAVDGNSTVVTLSMQTDGVLVTRDVTLVFNKIDANVSVPIVVIANNFTELNLTQNSQNVQMEVQVFEQGTNTPYISGNVKVSLPNEVLTGTDVGSFSEYTVPVGSNGKAVFNYTGPQDLQSLVDNGDLNATFDFYHEENPTQQETITVIYDLQAGYIPANYILSTSSSDGNQTMGLEVLKSFTLYLKDDAGNLIDDALINTVTITSQNTLIGQLVDAANGGNNVATLTFSGVDATNSKSFSIQTYRLSGLLPIEITVDFTDANGDPQTLTITMNIVVLSGPPTALSISYAGVEVNATTAKYIEKFVVTVTDTYNNPVNTSPYIATGAIVEYAVDGSDATGVRSTTSPRLWHGTNDLRGDLEALGSTAQFTTILDAFNWVDINNDRLVVFGEGFAYEAFGKWDIDNIAAQLLGLKDNYFGTTRPDVLFAVGHNNRQDLCSVDARQYVGNMKADNYQLDQNGHAFLEFEYDYHLTGKDIMVWVNLTGFQADNNTTGRIGDAQKHTLRGAGFESSESYTLEAGAVDQNRTFYVEHVNAPEVYRNGHFTTSIEGTCTVNGIIDSSNLHDARECTNTQGYIVLSVSNNTADVCTIQLNDSSIAVTPEFSGVSAF